MSDEHSNRTGAPAMASAMIEVVRELKLSVPAPRGAPFFCLDAARAYDLGCLEALSERGIFRKYEFVLLLGCGFGGEARWLATRLGCRVLGMETDPAVVAAATLLNLRAHLQGQVSFQVGAMHRLPLRPRLFTHVWVLGEPPATRPRDAYGEMFRVLRPGAHVALHLDRGEKGQSVRVEEALDAAGFVDIEKRRIGVAEQAHSCRIARLRLNDAVPGAGEAEGDARRGSGEVVCVQIFGRRPS